MGTTIEQTPAPPALLTPHVVNEEPLAPEAFVEFIQQFGEERRFEYIHGWVVEMAGGSLQHGRITMNVVRALSSQVLPKGFEVMAHNLRVALDDDQSYVLPDVVVFEEPPEIEMFTDQTDVLTNPLVVFEVLSPSTRDVDTLVKGRGYRQLETLQEIVTIEQETASVTVYRRGEEETWILKDIEGLDQTLNLPSLDARLPLTDVYRGVLDEDEPETP